MGFIFRFSYKKDEKKKEKENAWMLNDTLKHTGSNGSLPFKRGRRFDP